MNGKLMLYRDQHGHVWFAHSAKELQRKLSGRISKMYVDRDGKTFHEGYVVGNHWCRAFVPYERQV